MKIIQTPSRLPVSSWILAAALITTTAGGLIGQSLPPSTAFEVASIHEIAPPFRKLKTLTVSGARITLEGYNVGWLIAEAFGLRDYQVSIDSVPRASQGIFYNIEARAPGQAAPTQVEVRAMLQALLGERFHLAIHREMRNMPVYALVVDKDVSALKPGSGDDECASLIGPVRPEDRNYRYRYTNCTLEPLVNTLQADRPILNKTGLTGRYDITIFATPEFRMRDTSEVGDISFLDAVRKIGLRLEAQNASVEVIVIDHIDPAPTPN